MLAETACDLQIVACHLKKDGCHASGERSDGQHSLPRKMAKSTPKIWKFVLKCMREQKWCQTDLRKWAIFRSLGKTYYFLHSTRRKCPPISGGFEAKLGYGNVLLHTIFAKICSRKCASHRGRGAHVHEICRKIKKKDGNKHQKSSFLKQVVEIAKMNCKLWLQNGLKSKKCSRPSREQHFFWFLVAEEGPAQGDWKGQWSQKWLKIKIF